MNEPTSDVVQYEPSILGVTDLDDKKNSISSRIKVNADYMSEILERNEQIKNNQIQYIGDIKFKHRESDPCGFSKILIKEGDDEDSVSKGKRIPIIIFDENGNKNQKFTDDTENFYDVVAGESIKKIIITLDNLQNKNVFCNGVMLPEKSKHDIRENVFQMNKVTYPFKNKKGHYVVDRDYSSIDKIDYDYRKSTVESIDISKKQGLILGKDYEFKGENKLQLNLSYIYNKHMLEDSPIRTWGLAIGELAEGIMDQVWMFNYFFLTESKAQTYFVPIGTCRYPNQLAKVRIFPEIKWEVFILIKPKDDSDFYTYSGMPEGNTENKQKINLKHFNKAIKATKTGKIDSPKYGGELHIKCTVDNKLYDLGIALQSNLNKIIEKITTIKDILDSICHRNVATDLQKDAKKVLPKVSKAISSPVFLEFSLPTIRIGGEWKFDVPDVASPEVKCIGSLKIGFEPLIKAKGGIDLLALASKIPPVGAVLTALDYLETALGWVAKKTGVQVSWELIFNLYAKGEVKYSNTIDFLNPKGSSSELKLGIFIGIEFGFTIKATISKVIFVAGDKNGVDGKKIDSTKKVGFEGVLTAEAETGFEGKAIDGFDKQGRYVQFKLDYLGITLKVIGKLTIYNKTGQPGKKGFNIKKNIVDRYDEILKTDKMYVL